MRKLTAAVPFTSAILATAIAIVAHAQTPSDPYTWTPVIPALTTPRADACAAALPDGSAFVTGGVGADGSAISSVEMFQLGVGFSSAPAMNTARAAHTCTALPDGRILVAGGNDGHGNPVGTAEIYDPIAQAWSIVADLNDPRWGHTATLLHNGRVLIAGGQDALGQKDTLELFKPKASAFVEVPVRLSSPRGNHAAALLSDGMVAIMGGANGGAPLATVDLYDPDGNTIIAAAPLLIARASHTASTLADGTVLVAGGWDGTNDFAAAEIYDVQKGSALTLSQLSTARHGHFAVTLPGNGNVLVGAGVGAGAPLASCELYSPSDGTFSLAGPLASPRARSTAVPVAGGMVLSAGGVSTDGVTPISSTGVLAHPSATWDLIGFTAPYGGDLNVHGRNFPSGSVTFSLEVKNRGVPSSQTINTVRTTGNFDIVTNSLTKPADSGVWNLLVQPSLPAVSVIQPVVFANVALSSSCNPCLAPSTLNPTGVQIGTAMVTLTAKITVSDPKFFAPSPAGASVTFLDGSLRLGAASVTATSSTASLTVPLSQGVHTITATIGAAADGFGGTADGFIGRSGAVPVTVTIVVPIPTTVSVSLLSPTESFGNFVFLQSMVTFNVAIAMAQGQTSDPTGTITYSIGSQKVTFPIGQLASIATPAPGSYKVTAAYSGDVFFSPSTSAPVTLTITAVPTTVSVTANPNPVATAGTVTLKGAVAFRADANAPPTGTIAYSLSASGLFQLIGQASIGTPVSFQAPVAVGSYSITAAYSGDGFYAAATSAPVTLTVSLPTSVETFYGAVNGGIPAQSANLFWTIHRVTGGAAINFSFGDGTWFPVVGDWGGFGQSGVGAFDPATDTWHLAGPPGIGVTELNSFQFGRADCSSIMPLTGPPLQPFMGDWVGRGRAGIGVYDPSTGAWCLKNLAESGQPDAQFLFAEFNRSAIGIGTQVPVVLQVPVVGDWDGNGTTTVGTYDFENQLWLLRNENSQGPADGGVIHFPNLPSGFLLPFAGGWTTGSRKTGLGIYNVSTDSLSTDNNLSFSGVGYDSDFGVGLVSGTIAK